MKQRTAAAWVPYRLNREEGRDVRPPVQGGPPGVEFLEGRVLMSATYAATPLLTPDGIAVDAASANSSATYLAGPRKETALAAARRYVRGHAATFGLRAADADSSSVQAQRTDPVTGLTCLTLRPRGSRFKDGHNDLSVMLTRANAIVAITTAAAPAAAPDAALTAAPAQSPLATATQTVAMPPFTQRGSLGVPVFQSVSPTITLGAPDDTVDITFDVNLFGSSGQTLSFAIIPADGSAFRPEYQLFAPSGGLLGGGGAGGMATARFAGTNEAGTHVLRVTGNGGTTGAFTVLLTEGAGMEWEELGSPFRNDVRLHAESVNAFMPIHSASGASIVSLLGAASQNVTPDDDWYSFYSHIPQYGATTIAAARVGSSGPAPALAVYDNQGTLVASGTNGIVSDFLGTSLQLYYVKVSADPGTEYQLTLTRNASLETEPNDTIATADTIQTMAGAAGMQPFLGQLQQSDVDLYKLSAGGNVTMQFSTSTLGGEPGNGAIDLNPRMRLLSTIGVELASDDNSAADGRDARLSYSPGNVPAADYYVEVSRAAGSTGDGAYLLTTSISSAAPGTPDLVAASDTGALQNDDLTRLNNASPAAALHFNVPGTVAGATVKLYAGGTQIGSTAATGTSTVVTTNGAVALADGSVSITARQSPAGMAESSDSPALTLTVDTASPSAVATFDRAGSGRNVIVRFNEPIWNENASAGAFSVERIGPGPGDNPVYSPVGYDAQEHAFTFGSQSLPADGNYRATFAAGGVSDLAGNALAADASVDFFILPGDADGDRTVGPSDFNILASHFGESNQTWPTGDFDGDGVVGPGDFNLLASRFGMTLPAGT